MSEAWSRVQEQQWLPAYKASQWAESITGPIPVTIQRAHATMDWTESLLAKPFWGGTESNLISVVVYSQQCGEVCVLVLTPTPYRLYWEQCLFTTLSPFQKFNQQLSQTKGQISIPADAWCTESGSRRSKCTSLLMSAPACH